MNTYQSKILNTLNFDGYAWSDADGLSWDEPMSFVCGSLFGFCGCGDNVSALQYIRDALVGIQNWLSSDESRDAMLAQFHSDGERYFVWYRLDNLGCIEHGSNVPGWLTEKGKDWLLAINEVLAP